LPLQETLFVVLNTFDNAANYWSSTENSDNPQNNAWNQNLNTGGGGNQNNNDKDNQNSVRCSQVLK
jgi:hypothetical protein